MHISVPVQPISKREENFRELFIDKISRGMFQCQKILYHSLGINCKLSGSIYAASEIEGAIPLIHGPKGCAYHQRLTPMKMYSPISCLPCTEMDENDVIYGGAEKLKEKIKEVYQVHNPPLILVLPTCTSALIGDDVAGICEDLNSQIPCPVVSVASEGFAHRRRESLEGLMKETLKSWRMTTPPDYDIRGCGQEEVFLALVDQLMEEQDVEENLVNMEFPCLMRYWGRADREEVKRIFAKMGAGLNTTLLSGTVEEVKRAPRARLNIVSRQRLGAKKMEERFGTGYLRKWMNHYGLDGMEEFLLEVGEKLGREGEAEEVARKEKLQAQEALRRPKRTFSRHSFAIFTQDFFFTPFLAGIYCNDLGLPIKYFCVSTYLLRSTNVLEETIEGMLNTMEELFAEWGTRFEMVVNPTLDELGEISKNVDYLVSDRPSPLNFGKLVDVSDAHFHLFRTGFSGMVEFGRYVASQLNKSTAVQDRRSILSRFDYDPNYYPLINDLNGSASRQIWMHMWCQKEVWRD